MRRLFAIVLCAVICFGLLGIQADPVYATQCPDDSCVYNAVVSEAANCVHGNIWKYTCKKCGHTYFEDDEMRTDEHQFVQVDAKEPTETERGNIAYRAAEDDLNELLFADKDDNGCVEIELIK